MKIRSLLFSVVVLFPGPFTAAAAPLFDAQNPASYVIQPDTAVGAFKLSGPLLSVHGSPKGYIRTAKVYSNFRLRLDWRWTGEPGNSGVLLHISDDDAPEGKVWPSCVEAQLKHEGAGDLVLIGRGTALRVNGKTYTIPPDGKKYYQVIPKAGPTNEKAPGEWNHYDITVREDRIELRVNGSLQNTATHVNRSQGYIALQSEGTPVEFRNMTIEPLE